MIGLAAAVLAGPAAAGAWTQSKGHGQVIVKFEAMNATQGFDPSGDLQPLAVDRRDTVLGVFAEYGLAEGLTLQLKADWQSGEDQFVDYEGRGPLEIGVAWQAWRDDNAAFSLYAGYADGGEGRNAGYAPPGQGDQDWEVRASLGGSLDQSWGAIPQGSYVEVQAARRMRQGLPDETRMDFTAGSRFRPEWLLLAQAYGGQADDGGPKWLSVEASVVRDIGDWSLQAGWRQTVAGRETPASGGPIIGVWRRF
ncbi:hypothetical protein [Brevundimonas sp. Root1279]|uniref:hypothetical protein n=1 Tax=Brevundimonas sp. Root1279 TaxID=1736443 RepID=UPI0006F361FF|nr:hypothetical protein [Brevundimonas sp. Root1279]KQW84067.1 hypothetical protein ASC65_05495 [Brevundimonas sp. Root1279]